jgi:hypothetical protein
MQQTLWNENYEREKKTTSTEIWNENFRRGIREKCIGKRRGCMCDKERNGVFLM